MAKDLQNNNVADADFTNEILSLSKTVDCDLPFHLSFEPKNRFDRSDALEYITSKSPG